MESAVFFHLGDELNRRTQVKAGTLRLEADRLVLQESAEGHGSRRQGPEPDPIEIPYRDINQAAEIFRLHFICHFLRYRLRRGRVYLTVPLVKAFGVPVVTNFTAQLELMKELDRRVRHAWDEKRKVEAGV